MDRAHLGEAAQHLDEVLALEALAGRGHELDERLAGVPAFADDEVPEIAAVVCLVIADEPLLARPVLHGVTDCVAEVGRQPAFLDLEHLVPTARFVETERRPVLELSERVLHLVAVVEDRRRGDDRLEWRIREPSEPAEGVGDLHLLGGDLRVVREILEPTAATGRVVRARRLDALGARLHDLERKRLRVAALHVRHARAHRVAGQTALDEEHEPVQPRDAVAAVGERVDVELELLILGDGRGHGQPGYPQPFCPHRYARHMRRALLALAAAIVVALRGHPVELGAQR